MLVIFALVATFASPAISQKFPSVEGGEVRLRSGVILKHPDSPSSVKAITERLREQLNKSGDQPKTGMLQKKAKSKAKLNVEPGEWLTKAEVVRRPPGVGLPSICSDYATYVVQPRLGIMPAKLQKAIVHIDDPTAGESSKCEFEIRGRVALVNSDGSPLGPQKKDHFQLAVGAKAKIPAAILAFSRRPDVAKSMLDLQIYVPIPVQDTAKLEPILKVVAKSLFKRKMLQGHPIRMTVLAIAGEGKVRFPGLLVMAFPAPNGEVVLINDMKLKFMMFVSSEQSKPTNRVFLEITSFDTVLTKASRITGKGDKQPDPIDAKSIFWKRVNKNARMVLSAAGRFAAEQYGVDRIVVVSSKMIPDKKMRRKLRIPIDRKGDEWVLTDQPKQ